MAVTRRPRELVDENRADSAVERDAWAVFGLLQRGAERGKARDVLTFFDNRDHFSIRAKLEVRRVAAQCFEAAR